MRKSRSRTVYINSTVALFTQIIQVLLGFIVRRIFIQRLGLNYLGYNAVFSNVLQMLNLADLGIGVAITSFLYKPLAEGDQARIAVLMQIYKRLYQIIGIVVLCVGLCVSCILEVLIPDAACSAFELRCLFYINLAGTVSTYFLAYKRTLLIADQKHYITSAVDMLTFLIFTAGQIIVLFFMPSYALYTALTVFKNILSNIIISISARKLYGCLKTGNTDLELYHEYRPKITQYIKDVFISRIGSYVYYGTDNIILSVLKGSLTTGLLSNYTLITNQVSSVISVILSSIQSTYGNYINATHERRKQIQVTDMYLSSNYYIGNFCMLCILFLSQPFISLVFGTRYVLSNSTVFWLAVNLMLTIMIQLPSQIFTVYRLFHFDRPIIVVSAILNIVVSVCLAGPLGIDGVLIGTFFTSLIYLFSRYYIISRKVFQNNFRHYMTKIFQYWSVSLLSGIVIYVSIYNLHGDGLWSFTVRTVSVGLLSVSLPGFFLIWTRDFTAVLEKMVPSKFRLLTKKRSICIITLCVICFSMLAGFVHQYNAVRAIPAGNKSLSRKVEYKNEGGGIPHAPVFHFSLDDVIDVFKDLTARQNEYGSIFDNATLGWLKELYDEYGVVVSLYCYYEDDEFTLDQCCTKFVDEFSENAEWLRFGFHARNNNTIYGEGEGSIVNDYMMTIEALEKIVGGSAIDNVIRLHGYAASADEIMSLAGCEKEPVVGLLTADDDRRSYGLSEEDSAFIYSHDELTVDGIIYIHTDLRMEYTLNSEAKIREFGTGAWNNQLHDLVIFTHERALNAEGIKERTETLCKFAESNGYSMIFFEDMKQWGYFQ